MAASLSLHAAGVTLLAVALYFYTGLLVSRLRGRLQIPAPIMSGDPLFERAVRIQANTGEQLLVFLPSLWLCAQLASSAGAGLFGVVWLVGRVIYAVGYYQAANKRSLGFAIAIAANAALFFGALYGVIVGL